MRKTYLNFNDLKKDLTNLKIIGKGWRGTVYQAVFGNQKVAVKVPNSVQLKYAIQKEAFVLSIVNKKHIGSKLILAGEDFLMYKFVEGQHLEDVLNENNYKKLLSELFYQARQLDLLGINKDEFQRPLKNAIVDKNMNITLIDFERAIFSKKPSNVTQLLQFIMRLPYIKHVSKDEIIQLGKEYKSFPDARNYEKILKNVLGA